MKKKNIKHESYQDVESVKLYLQQIIDGLDKGSLRLSNGDDTITLEPHGLLDFTFSASQGKSIQQLRFKIDWKPEGEQASADDDDLIIE